MTSIGTLFCSLVQNFIDIGQSAAELWQKMTFKMAVVRHFEFLKCSHFVIWLSSSSTSAVVQFHRNRMLFHWHMAISRFSTADLRHLEFMGKIMGSLKSPCRTSYRSSIETIALYCLVFEKITFLYAFWRRTDGQTDEQMDSRNALRRSRCCYRFREIYYHANFDADRWHHHHHHHHSSLLWVVKTQQ